MRSLFLLSYPILIGLILVLVIAAILQTYCLFYGFFSFRYEKKNLWATLLEGMILLQLWAILLCAAEVGYQVEEGFLLPRSWGLLRGGVFLGLTVLSLLSCRRSLLPLSVPLAAALTLPWTEELTGSAFPMFLFFAAGFWILRSIRHLWLYGKQRREQLSAFSVKEALDTMNFGLLFCRGEGSSRGQILLCNRKMQELMGILTGKLQHSGKEFYECLETGQVLEGCRKKPASEGQLYALPDGRVWRFDLRSLELKKEKCVLLIASDNTGYIWAADELRRQNRELEQKNQELRSMLRNLETIVRTEETLRAKGRVHDLLGQQISMLLRSVREHREPDEKLLQSFASGLPGQLQNAWEDSLHSLQMVADSFRSLGVEVTITGRMPADSRIQSAFFEISAEAMTNAVRHGYASSIRVSTGCADGVWTLEVEDNGDCSSPVSEGGGLREMRRKAEQLGGSFSYTAGPHFQISVTIPEGGEV